MYCKNCGNQIPDNADVCVYCGVSTGRKNNIDDSGSAGWGVLGFFFPIIGFILFLVWHSTKPRSAKAAGVGTLVGVILYVVAVVLVFVLGAAVIGSVMSLGILKLI